MWVFTFAGLLPADTMTAAVGEQRLMSARADQLGRATLSLLTSGTTPPEVTLEYRTANPQAELPRGQMFMSQTALTPIADIELSAAIEQLHIRDRSDGRTLYAIHGDGFSVVDITVPTRPMIMADHRGDDLRGAAFDGDSLVLFDRARPARFEIMDSLPRRDPCEQAASAVVRTLMSGQDHYVVRERSVDVYDRNLCQVRHVDLDRAAVSATMLGAYLVIGGDDGLTILDPTQREPVLRRFEMAAVKTVSTPQFGVPSDSILVRSSQGIGLYEVPADLGQVQQLVLLADVLEDPWFDRLATFGSHVATVSASKISISSIVGRARWCSV